MRTPCGHIGSVVVIARDGLACGRCDAPVDVAATPAIADVYTSRGPVPPGRSLGWLRRHIRTIPGATRIGGRRGRGVIWTVTRADYEAWLRAPRVAAAPSNPVPVAPVIDIDAWIGASGHRLTRRTP